MMQPSVTPPNIMLTIPHDKKGLALTDINDLTKSTV